jgi:serine/threonine protein kinase
MIGQTISHYRLLEKLGEGGMGVVYKAEDTKLKRTVALKFLPPELTRDKSAKTRFIHEAQAASALQHHNICTIHEIDETKDGRLFICMDCYDGETLKDKITKGPLPVKEAIDIALQVTEGLSEAHEAGIVHRDIKPGNILVTRKGVVKIVDFGLAKLAGMTKVTRTGTTVGTVAYMSPEQAGGGELDARSDIFSLGVVLYELLSGHLPFPGDHDAAVLYGIVHNEPEPLSKYRSDVPDRLLSVIGRALEKDPNRRYLSASDFKADLETIRGTLIGPDRLHAPGISDGKRPRFVNRRVLILAVLAVVVGSIGTFLFTRTKTPRTTGLDHALSVVDFTNLVDPDDPTISPGITGLVRVGLIESSPVRVISPEYLYDVRRRLFNTTRGPIEAGEALEIARKAGATMLLSGQIGTSGGEEYALWQLVDVGSGKSVASQRARGKNVMELADRIVSDALAVITNESGLAAEASPSVAVLATVSPEAYRYYVVGVLAREESKPVEAVRALEQAVQIDTTFALALVALSKALRDTGEVTSSRDYAEKAWRLRKHLGVKDRLTLEAWIQATVSEKYQEAFATYEEILTRWPDDREVLEHLVDGYLFFNRFPDVLAITKRGLALYPDDKLFALNYQY